MSAPKSPASSPRPAFVEDLNGSEEPFTPGSPRFGVYTMDMKEYKPSVRQRVLTNRDETREIRRLGPCEACRRKKMKCRPEHHRREPTPSALEEPAESASYQGIDASALTKNARKKAGAVQPTLGDPVLINFLADFNRPEIAKFTGGTLIDANIDGDIPKEILDIKEDNRLYAYVAYQLQNLFRGQVDFLRTDPLRASDYLKASLESFSGEPWNWWPFDPPRKRLLEDLMRLQWRCKFGELRRLDMIPSLAETCRELLNNAPMNEFSGELTKSDGGIIESFRGVFRNVSALISRTSGSKKTAEQQYQNASRGASDDSVTVAAQGDGNLTTTPYRWILLCSFLGHCIRPSQIEVTATMNDDDFFIDLRRKVRELRGLWRSYIHLKQFHSCSFSKFTRISSNWLVKYDRQELPECPRYEYAPRLAKLDPLDPTICAHEWYTRFYNCKPTEGFCRVIERVPKRDEKFEFQMHDKEEDMWGLHVELRISAAVVLAWLLFICAGGLGFFIWWMSRHNGDWQNAAVPLTVTMMALSSLLVPLNEHFNRPF